LGRHFALVLVPHGRIEHNGCALIAGGNVEADDAIEMVPYEMTAAAQPDGGFVPLRPRTCPSNHDCIAVAECRAHYEREADRFPVDDVDRLFIERDCSWRAESTLVRPVRKSDGKLDVELADSRATAAVALIKSSDIVVTDKRSAEVEDAIGRPNQRGGR
jgi:hypothetical protein